MLASTVSLKLKELISRKKLLIFDFDGVLVDSVEVKTNAFAELYKQYGEEIEQRVIEHHRNNGGMSRFDKFRYYHNEFLKKSISEKEISEMSKIFSKLVVQKVISAEEIKGSSAYLKKCILSNKICVVNSATPEDEITEIVRCRSLNKYFENIYGSPATKKQNLEKALQSCDARVDDAVFFGDAQSDFDAALEMGMEFVGVGKHIIQVLETHDYRCNWIEDFQEE